MKKFYLLAMVLGAAFPLYFFSQHFAAHGFGLSTFVDAAFANSVASGEAADLLLSAVFALFAFGREARDQGVKGFSLVVLGTLLIGLSFGLPLYFYLRATQLEARGVERFAH